MESAVESRAVTWWPVHEFIESVLAQANYGPIPWAGTPAWAELADRDPRKILALAVAGEHHVLRVEVAQRERADASKAVANAVDWAVVSRELRGINEFYAERPWLKRVVK